MPETEEEPTSTPIADQVHKAHVDADQANEALEKKRIAHRQEFLNKHHLEPKSGGKRRRRRKSRKGRKSRKSRRKSRKSRRKGKKARRRTRRRRRR